MARSRKLWTPPKPTESVRNTWTPARGPRGAEPASSPRPRRTLADVTKLQAARHDHGWRFEEFVTVKGRPRRGVTMLGARWTCDYQQGTGEYGCKSFVWEHQPGPGQFHAYDCPYWHLEGKDETPF